MTDGNSTSTSRSLCKVKEMCELATLCSKTDAHLRDQAYNNRDNLSYEEAEVCVMASRTR